MIKRCQKMMKIILSLLLVLGLTSCKQKARDVNATYDVLGHVYDYGERIHELRLHLNFEINEEEIDKKMFEVHTHNKSTIQVAYNNGERIIDRMYVVDEEGNPSAYGNEVRIHLKTNLHTPYAEISQRDHRMHQALLDLHYEVKQIAPLILEDGEEEVFLKLKQGRIIHEEADLFHEGKSAMGLAYRDYVPEKKGGKHPLIIWLHGAGGGGSNNLTHITNNRGAVAFVEEDVQELFDYPYVLAPQVEDYWMSEFHTSLMHLYGRNHTAEVVSLIKEYIEEHINIDQTRIYIGGCSMGGYQTWETIFAQPDLFAAAFPICAAYQVPREKMPLVKEMPIWLVHAASDQVVPVQNSRNAYTQMLQINDQVHYSEFEKVMVEQEEYAGHNVWIHALRNEAVNKDDETLFEWLSKQHK